MAEPGPTAVLVVHGIGEQLPMDTLRSFVDTLYGKGSLDESPPVVYNKLDRHSSFLDLRRLSLAMSARHSRVDFYELYWQPTFGSGTVGGVLAWAVKLAFRRARSPRMRRILWAVRLGLLLIAALIAGTVLLVRSWGWWAALAPLAPILGFLIFLPRNFLSKVLTEVLADASRWFSPGPGDIPERDQVRRLGLDLLERLHDPTLKKPYSRIVVVAHSLGSVVAYDVLRLAFDRLREPTNPEGPARPEQDQPAAWNFDIEQRKVAAPDDVPAFQLFQQQLHDEQQKAGARWLVSDFITVGSPLTHSNDLWGRADSFHQHQQENEFPRCPPLGEVQNSERGRGKPIPGAPKDRIAFYRKTDTGPLHAHEASVFAQTRWTNLYFPSRWWLAGDPVGGELAGVFGPGVRDIPVRLSAPRGRWFWPRVLPVGGHTKYWQRHPATTLDDVHRPGRPDAVHALREAIDLERRPAAPYVPPPKLAATTGQVASPDAGSASTSA